MEPWQKWAVVGVAGAGAYIYYSRQNKSKKRASRSANAKETVTARADGARGKRRKDNASSLSDQALSDTLDVAAGPSMSKVPNQNKKRKGGVKPSGSEKSPEAAPATSPERAIASGDNVSDEADDKQFAGQLAGVTAGTSLRAAGRPDEARRAKKQAIQPQNQSEHSSAIATGTGNSLRPQDLSTASSTTGADADDDLTPATSPSFGAVETSAGHGDVSDMLESPSTGPSVLRLTASNQPQITRQSNPDKEVRAPETKKQRQRQQKKEQLKLDRAQAERERRALLEKQLRTAREAEGRPAKNGTSSAKPPMTSVWNKAPSGQLMASVPAAEINGDSLLDTLDEQAGAPQDSHKENEERQANERPWHNDLPSEEEQLRILSEMSGENGWNTVQKGRKKKTQQPKIIDASLGSGSSDTGLNGHADAEGAKPDVSEEAPRPKVNGNAKPQEPAQASTTGRIEDHPDYNPDLPYALTGHPDDSDWAVV